MEIEEVIKKKAIIKITGLTVEISEDGDNQGFYLSVKCKNSNSEKRDVLYTIDAEGDIRLVID